jgi:soluble lytic murein transglycosylase-like protein
MKRHEKLALFLFLSGIAFGTGVGTMMAEWRQMKTEALAASAMLVASIDSEQTRQAENLKRFFIEANPALDPETALYMAYAVQEAADRYNLPESILAGLIYTESRADPRAINRGCLGLTQVNWPVWKKELTLKHPEIFSPEDLFEPRRSILAGAWILRHYLNRYQSMDRALEAYSGGAKWYPAKVQRAACSL